MLSPRPAPIYSANAIRLRAEINPDAFAPQRSFLGTQNGRTDAAAAKSPATELLDITRMDVDAVLADLDASQYGLPGHDADGRLARYGLS